MKKIATLIFGLTFMVIAGAKAQFVSSQDVPAEIRQDLTEKFPSLKQVDWEKDGSKFKASFTVKKFNYSLVYDESGKVITKQEGIPTAALPADVNSGLSKNFPDLQVKEANKIEDKGKVSYLCVLADDNNATENVVLAEDGIVIKTDASDEQ